MMNAKRIGVLLGGLTAERDASMRAAEAVLAALREAGHDATPIFVDRDVDVAVRQARIDVAFLALRGRYGGDGCLQGVLEMLGIPYTGSGVLASSLATNRAKAKDILRLHNLPTAPAYLLRAEESEEVTASHGSFGFPVMVSPVGAAAAMGGTLAHDEMELEAATEEAFRVDDEVIVERLVEGRSVVVGVMDGVALGVTEPQRTALAPLVRSALRAEVLSTARLSPARYRSLLRVASQAYEALGCEGPACVELTVSEKLNEVIVEVDTSPLLTPTAPLPRIAHAAGMKFADLVDEILRGARVRAHGHKRNRRALQLSFEGHDRRFASAAAH